MTRIECFRSYHVSGLNVTLMATYQFGNGRYAVKFYDILGTIISKKEVYLSKETISMLCDYYNRVVTDDMHIAYLIRPR